MMTHVPSARILPDYPLMVGQDIDEFREPNGQILAILTVKESDNLNDLTTKMNAMKESSDVTFEAALENRICWQQAWKNILVNHHIHPLTAVRHDPYAGVIYADSN